VRGHIIFSSTNVCAFGRKNLCVNSLKNVCRIDERSGGIYPYFVATTHPCRSFRSRKRTNAPCRSVAARRDRIAFFSLFSLFYFILSFYFPFFISFFILIKFICQRETRCGFHERKICGRELFLERFVFLICYQETPEIDIKSDSRPPLPRRLNLCYSKI